MADELKATPRNALLGLLADALTGADAYASKKDYQGGLLNPPLNVLSGLLGIGGAGRTLDRLSYGDPITNMGKGSYKPLIPQDTADAAGLLAMVAPAASRGALNASDAAVRAITGNKAANSMNVLAEAARMRPQTSVTGPIARNNMQAPYLQDLISSQRYIDRDIVAQKIKNRDFDVNVTPQFNVEGEKVRAITDGHHSLQAAIISGHEPNFIEMTPTTDDRISILLRGGIDDYLKTAYHDSPWYRYSTGADIW